MTFVPPLGDSVNNIITLIYVSTGSHCLYTKLSQAWLWAPDFFGNSREFRNVFEMDTGCDG